LKKLEQELPNRIGNQVEPLSVVVHAFNHLEKLNEVTNLIILGGGFLSYLAIHVAKTLEIKNVNLMTSSEDRRSFFSNFVETVSSDKLKQNYYDAAIDF
jgi:threonine dehydrogenase-like Zn-dependent dehydrogenase